MRNNSAVGWAIVLETLEWAAWGMMGKQRPDDEQSVECIDAQRSASPVAIYIAELSGPAHISNYP